MNKREFIRKFASASGALAALGTLPSCTGINKQLQPSQTSLAEEQRRSLLPNVPLMTHEGEVVRFYDDLVKDKTVLINFMYASCSDICPGMTANLKRVQNILGDRVGKDIFMYSVTLEPEHDTQRVLKAYADVFKIKPGWRFLTGRKEDIELLRKRLGFSFSDPVLDRDRTQHIGVVKYGIEPLQRWGACPAMGNPKYIAEYLYWMEPNGKRPDLTEMSA